MTINDEIAKLREEGNQKLAAAIKLSTLLAKFPDLQKFVGRWDKVAFYSKVVNQRVNRFDLRFNCGCCSDSPLELWPFLETSMGNVYSDPPRFIVGKKSWIGGADPSPGWRQKLRDAEIPEPIIQEVATRFKADAELRREIAASDNYEDEEED